MSLPGITRARLNDIAHRKLDAIGIETSLDADGQTLRGELVNDGTLRHPRTAELLPNPTFRVERHDALQIESPLVLSRLPALPFYEFDQPGLLLARLVDQLKRRYAAVRQLHDKLKQRGLDTEIDDQQGLAIARVELTGVGTVQLEADENGVFARWLLPLRGQQPVPLGEVPVDLAEFPDRSDLELSLSQYAEAALKQQREAPAPASPVASPGSASRGSVVAQSAPANSLTLQELTAGLEPEFMVAPGVVLRREWRMDQDLIRLDLRALDGQRFEGRLTAGERELWRDTFFLTDFPGSASLLQSTLSVAVSGEAPPSLQSASVGGVEDRARPMAGEIWVMSIQVLNENEDEIRYVTIDSDGQRFGAPCVLPRADFLGMFMAMGGAFYRLVVQIVSVDPAQVSYQHLNVQRQALGESRSIDIAAFVASFIAEAAAY